MEINSFLPVIDIPADNEEQLKTFLTLKGNDIQSNILKLWIDFVGVANDSTMLSLPVSNTVEGMTDTGKPDHPPIVEEKPENISTLLSDSKIEPATKNQMAESKIEPNPETNTVAEEILSEKKAFDALELIIKNKHITLPNAKVGIPYNFVFGPEKIGLTEIEDFWFDGLESLGLKFDPETDAITGVPIISGEQSVKLHLKQKGWSEGKPVFERKVSLIVNPDPRSLWKNLPSDKNDPYWKPDADSQFLKVESTGMILKTERKDIVAASMRGRSHAHEGIFRDDDFKLDYNLTTQWYIIAVADGAGSAKASRKGSAIACETVVKVCKSQLELQHKDFELLISELNKDKADSNRKKMGDALYGIVGSAVFKAYKSIEEEASKSGKPLKEFSTTLILTICKKFKFGWFVGAFWVGDGGIGIYDKRRKFLKVLGETDGGEFAGQTRFLTMPEITQPAELYRRLRFDIVEDFTALILMTDGITDPKFETDANLLKIEKWDELWNDLSMEVDFKDNNENTAGQLLKWLDFWSPGNHDDRTIAILY